DALGRAREYSDICDDSRGDPYADPYSIEPSLLIAQGDDGLDPSGTSGGEITGSQRNRAKRERYHDQCNRIPRRDAIKQERERPAGEQRSSDTEYDPDRRHASAVDDHHAHNCMIFRTQRHPDTDLLRALCDTVRDDAVDAGRSDYKRDECEDGENIREKIVERIVSCHHGSHRHDACHGNGRVDCAYRPDDLLSHSAWVAGCLNRDIGAPDSTSHRKVDFRSWRLVCTGVVHVSDHTSYGVLLTSLDAHADRMANRTALRPVPIGHRSIDDHYGGCRVTVGIVEVPPVDLWNSHDREVARRDYLLVSGQSLNDRDARPAVGNEVTGVVAVAEREPVNHRDTTDTR